MMSLPKRNFPEESSTTTERSGGIVAGLLSRPKIKTKDGKRFDAR
jgi:hypothetical protein